MTFFYDLNKRLDSIREKPETTHKQLNERDMSRAAKGYEKYGKKGMEALAKAGREGKALDPIRDKYNKYDENVQEQNVPVPSNTTSSLMKAAATAATGGGGLATQRLDTLPASESLGNLVKKLGGGMKKAAGRAMDRIAPGDEDLLKDLQKKTGMPQTGHKPRTPIAKEEYGPLEEKQADMGEGNAFALAVRKAKSDGIQPGEKITVGGKEYPVKEADMDESALQAYLGKKKYGEKGMKALQQAGREGASKEKMDRIRDQHDKMDEGWDDMMRDVERRRSEVKPGHKVAGAKGDIEKTATGIRHTRRYDPKTGETDSGDETGAETQKRGRGRPKGSTGKIGAKGPSGKSKLMTKEQELDEVSLDKIGRGVGSVIGGIGKTAGAIAGIPKGVARAVKKGYQGAVKGVGGAEADEIEAAKDLLTRAGFVVKAAPRAKLAEKDQPVTEKAVSKSQAVAARIARGVQKGEVKAKPGSASAEMAKSEPKELKKFAKTDTKGLPKKVKAKEEVDETTVSGSVATAPEAPKSKGKGGMTFGKGIYDSMNRELEQMIAESMNISMNMSNDAHGGPTKSLTVTATDEDAEMLGKLLKMAGMGGSAGGCGCNTQPCSCNSAEPVAENQPDWPTDTETSNDALQYAGGLNKPKTTVAGDGQTTVPVTAVQVREETEEELDEQEQVMAPESDDKELDEALQRMREMAGIREAAKPDYIDLDKDGDRKESMKKAADDKEKDKKVEESILAMTNLWKAYKG